MKDSTDKFEHHPRPREERGNIIIAAAAIALAVLAAYRGTYSVPLLFDDEMSLRGNPSLRHLESLRSVLFPPSAVFTAGRPLLNLSFAVNYAIGQLSVTGYHIVNVAIHISAAATLFGIVRRTLNLPPLKCRFGGDATLLGFSTAALWALHPIHTESVTYISQRAESLMGLFYFLTLYCFIRSTVDPKSGPFGLLCIVFCALGTLSKEVMVTAPVMVFLYDRTFLSGSFKASWERRWPTYLLLGATWLILGDLMLTSGLKHRDVGYGAAFTAYTYALTESRVVLSYLKLCVWPHPLVFDYGPQVIDRVAVAAPFLFALGLLVSLAIVGCYLAPSLGFLGAWFFIILVPTSSVVPLAGQPMAENRLYLPLAAVVVLGVVGLYWGGGRRGLLATFPALAILLGILTVERNRDYLDDITIWTDTVSKNPDNARAHNNLGSVLASDPKRAFDALMEYQVALKLNPNYPIVYTNLAKIYESLPGRIPDAIAAYNAAIKAEPRYVDAHFALGNLLATIPGQTDVAAAHLSAALKIDPDFAEAHNNLGNLFASRPRGIAAAISEFRAALKLKPEYAAAHNNLGSALAGIPGHLPEAISHLEAAIRINPDYADAHNNLGNALVGNPNRLAEAIAHFEEALRLKPEFAEARNDLGIALTKYPDQLPEAAAQFEAALKQKPDFAEAHLNLGHVLLAEEGREVEAWIHLNEAVRLRPEWRPEVESLRSHEVQNEGP